MTDYSKLNYRIWLRIRPKTQVGKLSYKECCPPNKKINKVTRRMIEFLEALQLKKVKNCFHIDDHIKAGMQWLVRAQDATSDGGVSIRYSMFKGWESSYPETTGYIIPTFLKYYDLGGDISFKERAVKMAEWELSIQQEDGSFIGGACDYPVGKLVFDAGQIMFGLLKVYKYTDEDRFLNAALKSADWLLEIQDKHGYWKKHSFQDIPHTYHSRVAWAIAQLYGVVNDKKYLIAVKQHSKWVLSNQVENGWFENAGFTTQNHSAPYTHTIAYTIRGLLEIGILFDDQHCIDAASRSINSLVGVMNNDGFFWGKYNHQWQAKENFRCLTGNAQISIICLRLYEITGELKYINTARALNKYLRLSQLVTSKNKNIKGAIAGSHPIWGEYERFAYPNWATKFYVDALMLEKKLMETRDQEADI